MNTSLTQKGETFLPVSTFLLFIDNLFKGEPFSNNRCTIERVFLQEGIVMVNMWVHFVTWIVLIIVAAIAVFSTNQKVSVISMMIARLSYIVAIITGIGLFQYAYQSSPVLTIVKIIFAILLMGIIEMSFAKKKQRRLNRNFAIGVIILILLLGLFGIYLASGFPF